MVYTVAMATIQQKKLEHLVEQKILEFLGDPDAGLSLKPAFVSLLKKRSKQNNRTVPHTAVKKRYGV